jgi:histidine triad (HIT) family protein
MDCVFCAIAAGAVPAYVVDEDDRTLAFLDRAAATRGHTLVVPKQHADDIWALPADDAAAVMRTAHRVAGRLRTSLAPDGLGLYQSNGRAAGQEVFHFHLHLVPRYAGDGVVAPWAGTAPSEADQLEVMRAVTGDPAGQVRGPAG